jgi:hypothetical protein
VLAGHQRGARGRADGHGAGLGEADRFRGKAVDVRRLVQVGPVAAEIGPTHVIGEDEEDVEPGWRRVGNGGGDASRGEQDEEESVFHWEEEADDHDDRDFPDQ